MPWMTRTRGKPEKPKKPEKSKKPVKLKKMVKLKKTVKSWRRKQRNRRLYRQPELQKNLSRELQPGIPFWMLLSGGLRQQLFLR